MSNSFAEDPYETTDLSTSNKKKHKRALQQLIQMVQAAAVDGYKVGTPSPSTAASLYQQWTAIR